MHLLPVAHRELRVAARQGRTYYGRAAVAAGALAAILFFRPWASLLGFQGGRQTFFLLAQAANLFCLWTGLYLTADAISRERREGTLGLLFLSHLHGWDVVLGKLIARVALAFYGLLAAMPVLALTLLAGGVTGGEFAWTMLVLVNTLFFATSLGLALSAVATDPRTTRNLALAAGLFLWLGLPMLRQMLNALGVFPPLATALIGLSPLAALAFSVAGPAMPGAGVFLPGAAFLPALLASHLEAWLFLALAARWTARVWRERPAGAAKRRWESWWRVFQLGPPETRAARRRRLLEVGAFYWLFARRRWKPLGPPGLVGLALAGLGVAWWVEGGPVPPWGPTLIVGFALHVLLKFWIAGEAAGVLVRHRQEGTFELLLSTPLTVQDILRGQFRALRGQFGPAVLVTAGLTAAYPLLAMWLEPEWDGDAATVTVTVALLAAAALVGDACALSWLASWQALAKRRPQHAAGRAVLRILFLPWPVLMLLVMGGAGAHSFEGAVALWFLIGLASDTLWAVYARERLRHDFHAAAAGQLARVFSPDAPRKVSPASPAGQGR